MGKYGVQLSYKIQEGASLLLLVSTNKFEGLPIQLLLQKGNVNF